FKAEGVDAVHQIDAEFLGDLLDTLHGVVEVAGNLNGKCAVVEGLGELAVGDFAAADEDDRSHQAGRGTEDGKRRAGVASRGAGSPAGADHAGMREGGGHAVIFETARRVHAFVLKKKGTRVHADVLGNLVGTLQDCLA